MKRYDIRKIIFAIPSLQGAGRQEILNICSKTGCQIQVVPGIYQLVKGEVTISKLRRVELQDLLGRDHPGEPGGDRAAISTTKRC